MRPHKGREEPKGSIRARLPLTKTVFIKSYGCQMNVYDAGRMRDVLAPLGYSETDDAHGADLVILNTCHIREKATDKVYSELGKLRESKEERVATGARKMTIAVAGCTAQAEGAEILRRQPAVDLVFGPQTYHRLPEFLARAAAGARVVDTEFPLDDKFEAMPQSKERRATSAYLTIQEGCDKFCTFCVVPYTRGAEISRPVAQVEREALALVEAGARELTLLGQNVNAYRGPGPEGEAYSLARLADRLARIPDLARIRYMDQPSARCQRRSDLGPPRQRKAHAVSAFAGAVGVRPHSRGDEPSAHGR